jgi:hypothetical protein
MNSVYFCLLLSILVFTHHFSAAQESTSLASQAVIESLKPLRNQTPSTMTDAATAVQSLGVLYKTTFQGDKNIYDLAVAINELFKKEADFKNAENQIEVAETLAKKKEAAANHALTVGSSLTGPQPRQAAIYIADAHKIREQAKTMRDTAEKDLLYKINAVDRMAGSNLNSGNTAVAVALGNSIYSIVDRSLRDSTASYSVTREWLSSARTNPTTQVNSASKIEAAAPSAKQWEGLPVNMDELVAPTDAIIESTPSYDETIQFINAKIYGAIGYGKNAAMMIHREKSRTAVFNPKQLNREVRFMANTRFGVTSHSVLLQGRNGAEAFTIWRNFADKSFDKTSKTSSLKIEVSNALDAEKVAKAYSHLILMFGGEKEAF